MRSSMIGRAVSRAAVELVALSDFRNPDFGLLRNVVYVTLELLEAVECRHTNTISPGDAGGPAGASCSRVA